MCHLVVVDFCILIFFVLPNFRLSVLHEVQVMCLESHLVYK